jgi:hypothetical protein
MKTKKLINRLGCLGAGALLAGGLSTFQAGATVFTPVSAVPSGNINGTANASHYSGSDNIWNSSSLLQTGGDANILNWTISPGGYGGGCWVSQGYSMPQYIIVNLGAVQNLQNIYLWNGGWYPDSYGIVDTAVKSQTVDVSVSSDNVTFNYVKTLTLNTGAEGAAEPTQEFSLGGTNAQYVKLTVTASVGGTFCSLGSVRFDDVANTRLNTTTALSEAPSTTVFGSNVVLTASVSPSGATGSITFNDNGFPFGTAALNGGTAVLTNNTLSVGQHSITAQYGGDPTHNGSLSPVVTELVISSNTATGILTPISAVASSIIGGYAPSQPYGGSDNIWDGVRMTTTGDILTWTKQSDDWSYGTWQSNYQLPATNTVNLGAVYNLQNIYLWNGNSTIPYPAGSTQGYAMKSTNVTVIVSTDGVNFTVVTNVVLTAQLAGLDEPTQVFPLGGINAQYVQLVPTAVADPLNNNYCCSLGAVRFSAGLAQAVVVLPPTMTITKSGANVLIDWPATSTGFTLTSSSSLTTPFGSWTTVGTGSVVGANYEVSVPVGTGDTFFRLVHP